MTVIPAKPEETIDSPFLVAILNPFFLRSKKKPEPTASHVDGPLNHPSDLSAWCYLWEGNSRDLSYPPPAKSDIPKLAREYAEKYLSEVNQSHES